MDRVRGVIRIDVTLNVKDLEWLGQSEERGSALLRVESR